jgi:LuxR family maltose regulon positive regulatory protein
VTPPASGATGAISELWLKVTPPRVPRHLLARPHLSSTAASLADRPVILVRAPPGFGKTSLLAQWRLEHLAQGTVVAWLSAQPRDEPDRLAQCLALSVRISSGRQTFCHTLLEGAAPGGLEGITAWLAELARAAFDTVLFVDEADSLPEASREALVYLLRNAPANLRCVIAARPDFRLDIEDLVAYGRCIEIGAGMLRFRLEESLELAHVQLNARIDNDTAARLHELTEGWPLGLQLAVSAIAAGAEPRAAVSGMAGRLGELREHLVGVLLSNLDTADVDFLVRISILEDVHPDLSRSLSGDDHAPVRLARLARDTPVFVAGEHSEWMRMSVLARETLRRRFTALPASMQGQAHARAAAWLDEHGLLEPAARHALAAGLHDKAYELAERSLYESIMKRGRQSTVLGWMADLPDQELDRRPRLLLAAAWSLAISERHEEAGRLVQRLLAQPEADDALRCEGALILGGAAVFADEPDRFAELHDPWSQEPPLHDSMLLNVHANRTAYRALLEGDPALARLRRQHLAPHEDLGHAVEYVDRWGEFIIALTYLWEGQVRLAENLLRPALAGTEGEQGRRSPFACMLAALLAASVWERDHPDEAASMLADRLDVLERCGLPESLLLAYRTLVRIAVAEGAEHRAIELLDAMEAVGAARRLPRLRVASLADRVRMHARRYRAQTCRDLCRRIEDLLDDPALPQGRLWRRSVAVMRDLAFAYASIAAQDWRGALQSLAGAGETAQRLRLGRAHVEVLGLRAFALDRCGEQAQPLLREAMGLAQAYGLQRVLPDAHPDLGEWIRQSAGTVPDAPMVPSVPLRPRQQRGLPKPAAGPGAMLTAKEREVLDLLARHLSNKEIGRAMQAGETTVKWHVKNLFAKLDAGTRKQVVLRARILGLLPPA